MNKVELFKPNTSWKPIATFDSIQELDIFTSCFMNEAQLLNYFYNDECSIELIPEDYKIEHHFKIRINSEVNGYEDTKDIMYKGMYKDYLNYDFIKKKMFDLKDYEYFRYICNMKDYILGPTRVSLLMSRAYDKDNKLDDYLSARKMAFIVYNFEQDVNKIDIKPKDYYKKKIPEGWKK